MTAFATRPVPRTQYEWAKFWWQMGFNVIPLVYKTKTPPKGFDVNKYKTRRVTEEELKEWFNIAEKRNIGVICGAISDNLTVTDFDDKKLYEKAWSQMRTKTLVTETGRGIQVFIKTAYPQQTRDLRNYGIPIEIRGEGVYCVLPPSIHPTVTTKKGKAKQYKVISETLNIMEWQGDFEQDFYDIIKTYRPKFKPKKEPVDIDKILAGVEYGRRNWAAIRVASWYRKAGLEQEETEEKMHAWNERNRDEHGDPDPLSEDELQTVINSAYKKPDPYTYRWNRSPSIADLEKTEPLTEDLERFLKDPKLGDNIRFLLGTTIVGEEALKSLHFYQGIGAAIFVTPWGIIIVDRLGTGKSYVQREEADIFPKERVEQPTSLTQKVVLYLADNYKGRIVRIDELFGEQEGLPFIRMWMSEGRLEHWVTDPDTRERVKIVTEGCPAFWTSTTVEPEEQYGSRNWIASIDTSTAQTKRVHKYQHIGDALPKEFFKERKANKEFLTRLTRWLLQNAKPVVIPFLFSFPTENPRVRRDRPRFSQLIRCVANAYQLQRKTLTYEGTTYIIAEIADFQEAFRVAEPFLQSSVYTLDKYCLKIIKYMEDSFQSVTCPELAKELDMPSATVYRKMRHLQNRNIADCVEEKRPKRYRLAEDANIEKVEIKIVDDGSWLNEYYDRLDDPEVVAHVKERLKNQEYFLMNEENEDTQTREEEKIEQFSRVCDVSD